MFYENAPRWIREIPGHFKTQEMCNETVAQFSYTLRYVPDHLKTQKVCNQAVSNNPAVIFLFPDRFKTHVFLFVVVTQQQIDVWYDDDYWYHDDEIIECYNGYQKHKA